MRAETRLHRGGGLLLAALLATGCASLAPRPGPGASLSSTSRLSPMQPLRHTLTASLPQGTAPEDSLLHRRQSARAQGAAVGEESPLRMSGTKTLLCAEVPSGWPHLDSEEEVLAPFLGCTSPAAFLALQRTVDMPRLLQALSDWNAVRLGALGPLDADAASILQRKRAAFHVTASEKDGLPSAEVFALFVLHSSFDDELREVLRLLAEDKQLGETLGQMPVVREELQRRGLPLAEHPEWGEQASDVLRGLGRAGRNFLSSSPASDGARGQNLSAKRAQLPPPYQAALDEVGKAGTGHGAYSLYQGRYEQATRELAPAALMVALYAGAYLENS